MPAAPWWQDVITQSYNPPVEPGEDIGTPFHTDITALLPGTVSGISYGGYGARVDVQTPQGQVYYQHLDTVDVHVGQAIKAGQDVGLSGGQLFGGNLPNSPLNSTGPHVEVGYVAGGNPFALVAGGPQYQLNPYAAAAGTGSAAPSDNRSAPGSGVLNQGDTPGQQATSSSGGGLVNINFPDPIAGLRSWLGSGLDQAKANLAGGQGFIGQNIIPLAVAAVIILIVLGSGQKSQSAPAPQIIPVPV